MSAAGAPEQLWRRDPQGPERTAPLRVVEESSPAAAAFAELLEQLAPVCASAVDPLEIAAALESEGIGDLQAARYGHDSVFSLADAAFAATERHPPELEPPADPWGGRSGAPVLHALCYGLPAVCFPAAGSLLRGPVLAVLLVALLASWSATQAVGQLGYSRLGGAEPAEALGVLRLAGAGAAVIVAVAVMTTALVTHAEAGVWAFALGEGAYMAGASILLTLGHDKALLATLAPGTVAGVLFLASARPADTSAVTWVLLAMTPASAVAVAAVRTRHQGPRPRLRPAELSAALPAAGFGLVAASLLTLPIIAGAHGRGGPNPGAVLAAVPISLSMGVGEWRLLWFRRRGQALLRNTVEPRRFAFRARAALVLATGEYAVAAAALLAGAAAIAQGAGLLRVTPGVALELAGYLLLATAMFLALTLQALGARAVPLAVGAAAAGGELVCLRLGVAALLATASLFLVALAAYGLQQLGRATRHGF